MFGVGGGGEEGEGLLPRDPLPSPHPPPLTVPSLPFPSLPFCAPNKPKQGTGAPPVQRCACFHNGGAASLRLCVGRRCAALCPPPRRTDAACSVCGSLAVCFSLCLPCCGRPAPFGALVRACRLRVAAHTHRKGFFRRVASRVSLTRVLYSAFCAWSNECPSHAFPRAWGGGGRVPKCSAKKS